MGGKPKGFHLPQASGPGEAREVLVRAESVPRSGRFCCVKQSDLRVVVWEPWEVFRHVVLEIEGFYSVFLKIHFH